MISTTAIFAVLALHVFGQSAGQTVEVQPDDTNCLGCLCEAMSDCSQSKECDGDICGPFKITLPYWIDSGKLVVNNDKPTDENAFKNCVTDSKCAGSTVTAYFRKFSQDCDKDGKITCYDYAYIHRFGGYGCADKKFDPAFSEKFDKCLKQVSATTEAGK